VSHPEITNPSNDLRGSDGRLAVLPCGKLSHNYGKSQCTMGKSTISMVIFNSKLLPEGKQTQGLPGISHVGTVTLLIQAIKMSLGLPQSLMRVFPWDCGSPNLICHTGLQGTAFASTLWVFHSLPWKITLFNR